MPKTCYVEQSLSAKSLETVARANEILENYARQGFDLTLRQLYYQFVSRALIANTMKEYKRLGETINNARLAGLIDWNHITDRTRNLRGHSHWDTPADIVSACAYQFRYDLWADQPNHVEVWVEKDALAGVLDKACGPLDVSHFSCRGYTSQSEMWAAAMRLVDKARHGKRITIIHLGDHDPSGIDMTRDIEERIELFFRHHVGSTAPGIRRIALNMNQIEEYTPPPNPAKTTDSRYQGYMQKYGEDSWELDALEPAVLVELITKTVASLRDDDLWDAAVERQNEARRLLTSVSRSWDDVVARIEGEDTDEA